tara:strand:+ start:115 stop:2019 length:1905 start_codon:yes stop_codon:yes gene_type:complete
MAYKSRVTNKYMGSSFAGQVASSRTSSASDLINVLQKDVNPALSKIADKYVETKKDTAKEKLNELFLTKDSQTIQQEILAGKHPELSSKFVEKTVSQHTGKHEAIDAIAKIESEKEQNYDFRETNLAAFYKNYLPKFDEKDGSYALGFASVFNQYKAKQFIADAEIRSKYAKEQKINQGSKIISKADVTDVWDIVNKDLIATKLPPEEGQTTSRQFYSNEEGNEVVIKHATDLYNTATGTDEIDRAIKILSTDRGMGKAGTKLGSLVDTNRTDVSELVGKLNRKRTTLENQDRINLEYKEKKDISKIFAEAFSDNEDGTSKTHAQKMEYREQLEKFGKPSLLSNFSKIMNENRFAETDPAAVDGFLISVLTGNYTDLESMTRDFANQNIPTSELTKAITYFDKADTRRTKGVLPIHLSNPVYKASITQIQASVKGNFTKSGIFASNGSTAIFNATNYMIIQVDEFEERFMEENKRKVNNKDRQEFIKKLGDYVIQTYKNTVSPEIMSMTEKEVADKEADDILKATKQKYDETGVTDVLTNITKSLKDKTFKVPKMTGDDTSYFKSRKTERKEFTQAKIIPAVADYLKQLQVTPEFYSVLTNPDAEKLASQIASSLGIDLESVKQAVNNIVSKGN